MQNFQTQHLIQKLSVRVKDCRFSNYEILLVMMVILEMIVVMMMVCMITMLVVMSISQSVFYFTSVHSKVTLDNR